MILAPIILMNLAIPASSFSHNDIIFTEPKNNNIMTGQFTKMLYSTELFTMNEIYLGFPIKPYNENYSRLIFNTNNPINQECVTLFKQIEVTVLDYYKENFDCKKTAVYKLAEQLSCGSINLYSSGFGGFRNNEYQRNKLPHDSWSINSKGLGNHIDSLSEVTNIDLPTSAVLQREAFNIKNIKDHVKYAMKISGVWETDTEIGITFKLVECKIV